MIYGNVSANGSVTIQNVAWYSLIAVGRNSSNTNALYFIDGNGALCTFISSNNVTITLSEGAITIKNETGLGFGYSIFCIR